MCEHHFQFKRRCGVNRAQPLDFRIRRPPAAIVESVQSGAFDRAHPERIKLHRPVVGCRRESVVPGQCRCIAPPVKSLRVPWIKPKRMLQICSTFSSFVPENEPEHLVSFGEVGIECDRPSGRPQRFFLRCRPIIVSTNFPAADERYGTSELRPGRSKFRIDLHRLSQGSRASRILVQSRSRISAFARTYIAYACGSARRSRAETRSPKCCTIPAWLRLRFSGRRPRRRIPCDQSIDASRVSISATLRRNALADCRGRCLPRRSGRRASVRRGADPQPCP